MTAPRFAGHCDAVVDGQVHGWAWDAAQPDRAVAVEVLVDGRPVACAPADGFRADLPGAGIGEGHHHFRIPLPLGSLAPGRRSVTCRIAGSGWTLPGTVDLKVAAPDAGGGDTFVGMVEAVNGRNIEGWAANLLAPDRPVVVVAAAVARGTGLPPVLAVTDRPRPDLVARHGGHSHQGFVIEIPAEVAARTLLRLRVTVANTGVELAGSPLFVDGGDRGLEEVRFLLELPEA